jgi:REP element-mobilizing transposase RayT
MRIHIHRVRKQLSLLSLHGCEPRRLEHGGEVRLGLRKLARPIATRRPMHLVLRSSRAQGRWSLRRPESARLVRQALQRFADRHGVRVYKYANAGNHLHLLVRARCRTALQNFLRAFAGITARLVTGARKGAPVGKFWDMIAYSRIVQWGREFATVRAYVVQNELEAAGCIPFQNRKRFPRRSTRRRARNHCSRGSLQDAPERLPRSVSAPPSRHSGNAGRAAATRIIEW